MKRQIAILLCVCLCVCTISGFLTGCSLSNDNSNNTEYSDENSANDTSENDASEDVTTLDSKQVNSVAMLNYLGMVSQEIESSKHNRLFLENAYTSLINNTNPDKIDEKTQDHIMSLLDVIEEYRALEVKREHMKLLYNQDKARTIREAVPNPIAVLSVAGSLDWKRLAASVVYTAVDSYNNYRTANEELDKQYMISGWDLDAEEKEVIHKNRKRAFDYMVDVVRDNNLPGNLAINEEDIQSFVQAIENDNNYQKLQFLESREGTYGTFGYYWIELANSYYDASDYTRCLDSIERYKELYSGIFRKDYTYAEVLPKVIVAAQQTYSDNEYVDRIDSYTDELLANADNSDWALKYFAAQSYMDLYQKTNDDNYLEEVYQIALNNVNQLVSNQEDLNDTYLNDVKEIVYKEDDSLTKAENKEVKKEIKAYNKALKKTRKTELPSLYDPLVLNCDLLFSMAEELEKGENEQAKIEGILKTDTAGVFISRPVNKEYSFDSDDKYDAKLATNRLGSIELAIPADLLITGAKVSATVDTAKGTEKVNDWKIKEVKRSGKQVSSFSANYSSKDINKVKWNKGATVNLTIDYGDVRDPEVITYMVSEYKNNPIIPDKISFKRK